ncbi:glycosyltransferase [Pseudarthrobacter sp. MDT1-22]
MTEIDQVERKASRIPSVVFIGSFHGRKRGGFAEQAVREVSTRVGSEVRLTVIGPASDREYWHADTNHVSDASDREVLEIIGESWVLVSPSLYEGFGIPVFEALSVGTSTVASENPGSSYFGSLCRDSAALSVAKSDSEFVAMLEGRIASGPVLSDVDLAVSKEAVRHMLELASISRLVAEVYAPLIRADK